MLWLLSLARQSGWGVVVAVWINILTPHSSLTFHCSLTCHSLKILPCFSFGLEGIKCWDFKLCLLNFRCLGSWHHCLCHWLCNCPLSGKWCNCLGSKLYGLLVGYAVAWDLGILACLMRSGLVLCWEVISYPSLNSLHFVLGKLKSSRKMIGKVNHLEWWWQCTLSCLKLGLLFTILHVLIAS